jgi:hypothetical protein
MSVVFSIGELGVDENQYEMIAPKKKKLKVDDVKK